MNSIKGQKDMILKDELPRLVGAQYAAGEEWRNNEETPETIKRESQSEKKKKVRLWM